MSKRKSVSDVGLYVRVKAVCTNTIKFFGIIQSISLFLYMEI